MECGDGAFFSRNLPYRKVAIGEVSRNAPSYPSPSPHLFPHTGVSLLRLSLTSHATAARLLALPHVWRSAARAALLSPPAADPRVITEQQAAVAAVAVASTLSVAGAGTDSVAEGAAEAAAETAAQAEAEAGAAAEAGAHRRALLAHARFSAWCHSHSLRLTRLAAALPPAVGQGGGGSSRGGAGGGAGRGAAPPWAWQAPSAHDGAVPVPGVGRSLLCGGAEGGAGLAGAWQLSMADAFCLRVCSGSGESGALVMRGRFTRFRPEATSGAKTQGKGARTVVACAQDGPATWRGVGAW